MYAIQIVKIQTFSIIHTLYELYENPFKGEKQMEKQSRKFLITMNNPSEKGFDIDKMLDLANSLKGLVYACVSLEIGAREQTPHTHLFVYYQNPKAWKTMVNTFKGADVECSRGTCKQNREYVFKLGKWITTEKGTTSVGGQQKEIGTLPEEKECYDPQKELLYNLIKQGCSDYEIINNYPQFMFDLSNIQRCRLIIRQEEFKTTWRDLEVVYIYGTTGAGKSRYVMEIYGYENVFRVTDYIHPFDTYEGQDIIMFEEFNSSLRINDVLNYLDGYPCKLPARYSDKQACYTKVYITTNISLEKQYPNVQQEQRQVWEAFIRRITKVMWFTGDGMSVTYNDTDAYFNRNRTSRQPIGILNF